jgi:Flp pilus assembly protein TadG
LPLLAVRRLPRPARRLGRRGGAAVFVALSIPGLIGMVGLAAEVGNWYVVRRQAQTAADMAAYAAAVVGNAAAGDATAKAAAARAAALGVALANGFDGARSDTVITVNSPPTTGTMAANTNAVEVVVSRTAGSTLLKAASQASTGAEPANSLFTRTISARGVAEFRQGSAYCAYAKIKVVVSGSSNADFGDCAVHSNGTATDALTLTGNSSVKAQSMTTSGGCSGTNCNVSTAKITTYVAQVQNPFSDLDSIGAPNAAPVHTGQASRIYEGPTTSSKWTGTTFRPGVYRGAGNWASSTGSNTLSTYRLVGNSALNLTSGTYYLHNANLVIEGNSTVNCDGCTFVFTGDTPSQVGTLSITGNSSMALTAPSKGSGDSGLGGMLFVRAGGTAGTGDQAGVQISGNSTFNAAGGLYFGASYVKWRGNSSTDTNPCNGMVGGTLDYSGNSSVAISAKGCLSRSLRAPTAAPQTFLAE